MIYDIAIRKAAEEDLGRIQGWYEAQRPSLGFEFTNQIDLALQRIAAEPLSYPPMHRDVRRALVHRFPYKLWFRVQQTAVVVVACTHGVRGPAFLGGRLRNV